MKLEAEEDSRSRWSVCWRVRWFTLWIWKTASRSPNLWVFPGPQTRLSGATVRGVGGAVLIVSQDPGRPAKTKASVLMNNLPGRPCLPADSSCRRPSGKPSRGFQGSWERNRNLRTMLLPSARPSSAWSPSISLKTFLLYLPGQDIIRMKHVCMDGGDVNIYGS